MITFYQKPISISKGKTTITLALGVGSQNPDESGEMPIKTGFVNYKPWLKFEDTWYLIREAHKFDSLTSIHAFLRRDAYSEEQFLENIYKII